MQFALGRPSAAAARRKITGAGLHAANGARPEPLLYDPELEEKWWVAEPCCGELEKLKSPVRDALRRLVYTPKSTRYQQQSAPNQPVHRTRYLPHPNIHHQELGSWFQ